MERKSLRRELFLGVDAGGTRTRALLMTEKGEVGAFVRGGVANFEQVGIEKAMREIRHLRTLAVHKAGAEPKAAFYALAGCDRPYDIPYLMKGIQNIVKETAPFDLQNDSYAALRAGTPKMAGLALCAGTGLICLARTQEKQYVRLGGLGRRLGDRGTADQIVDFVLGSAVRFYEGRGAKTTLLKKMCSSFQLRGGEELIDAFLRRELESLEVAKILTLFFEAVAEGDALATQEAKKTARHYSQTVKALWKRAALPKQTSLVLSGGVIRAGEKVWQELLLPLLPESAKPMFLKIPPVFGAALLAMEKAGMLIDKKVEIGWKRQWQKLSRRRR